MAKPSEVTSLTAFRLAQIMDEVGLPPGVVNIVFGDGPGCGEGKGLKLVSLFKVLIYKALKSNHFIEPLVLHPKTELISFTGSTAVGARILEKTASQVKRVSLELGGKNPAVVFEDANFDKVTKRIFDTF